MGLEFLVLCVFWVLGGGGGMLEKGLTVDYITLVIVHE